MSIPKSISIYFWKRFIYTPNPGSRLCPHWSNVNASTYQCEQHTHTHTKYTQIQFTILIIIVMEHEIIQTVRCTIVVFTERDPAWICLLFRTDFFRSFIVGYFFFRHLKMCGRKYLFIIYLAHATARTYSFLKWMNTRCANVITVQTHFFSHHLSWLPLSKARDLLNEQKPLQIHAVIEWIKTRCYGKCSVPLHLSNKNLNIEPKRISSDAFMLCNNNNNKQKKYDLNALVNVTFFRACFKTVIGSEPLLELTKRSVMKWKRFANFMKIRYSERKKKHHHH